MKRPVLIGIVLVVILAVGVAALRFGPRLIERVMWEYGAPPVCETGPVQASGGTWTAGTPGPSARAAAVFTVLDDRIYQAGGFVRDWQPVAVFDVYDPTTDTWETLAPLPEARHRAGIATVNGRIYLSGGFDLPRFWEPTATSGWVYDPAADAWTPIADMPSARAAHVMLNIDDRLYVVGGQGPDADDIWVYDPASDTWDTSPRAPLPEPQRDNAAGVVYDGKIYLFGGRWVEQGNFGMVDQYDPAADTWTRLADMPAPRSTAAALVIGDRIHLFGGQQIDQSCTFATHDVYDPTADTWTRLADMPTPRHSSGVGLVDGRAVVVGGATGAGPYMQYRLSSVVEFWEPNE